MGSWRAEVAHSLCVPGSGTQRVSEDLYARASLPNPTLGVGGRGAVWAVVSSLSLASTAQVHEPRMGNVAGGVQGGVRVVQFPLVGESWLQRGL